MRSVWTIHSTCACPSGLSRSGFIASAGTALRRRLAALLLAGGLAGIAGGWMPGTARLACGEELPALPELRAGPGDEEDAELEDYEPDDRVEQTWKEFFFPTNNLTGRGMLNLNDPFPLANLHLQIPINTLENFKEGQGKIRANFNWGNSFAVQDAFKVDAETYQFQLSGWYAIQDDFYLGAGLSFLGRDEGVLDSLVNGFHELFDLRQGDREDQTKNKYTIEVEDSHGERHTLDKGFGLGDLILKSHWMLNRGSEYLPAVAMQTLVSLPTSTCDFGSNGVDLGISLSFYKRLMNILHIYGVLGATYFTVPKVRGISFEKVGFQAAVGMEFTLLDDFSLIGQAMYFSPLLKFPDPLDEGRNYLAAGFKWEIIREFELEFSVIENLFPFGNSADIAFVLGFDVHF